MKRFVVLIIALTVMGCVSNDIEDPLLSSKSPHVILFEDNLILKTFPGSFKGTSSFRILNYKKNVRREPFYRGREITLDLNGGILSGKVVLEIPWCTTTTVTLLEHGGRLHQVGDMSFSEDKTFITIDAKDLDEVINGILKIYIFKTIGIEGKEMKILGVGRKNFLRIYYEEQGLMLENCEMVLDDTSESTLTRSGTLVEIVAIPHESTRIIAKLLVNIESERILLDEYEMVIRDELTRSFEEFLPIVHLEQDLKPLNLVDVIKKGTLYHSSGYILSPSIEDLAKYGSSRSSILTENFSESSPIIYQGVFREDGNIFLNFWLFFEKNHTFHSSFFSVVLEENSVIPLYVVFSQNDRMFKVPWNDVVKIGEHPVIYVTRSGTLPQPSANGVFLKPQDFSLNVSWNTYSVERISSTNGLGLFCGTLNGEKLPPFRDESTKIMEIFENADVLEDITRLAFKIETQYGYLDESLVVPHGERVCIRLSPGNFSLRGSKILWFSEEKLLGEGPEILAEFCNSTKIDILIETKEGLIGFENYRVIPLERPSKPVLRAIDVSKDKVHLSWDCEGRITCFELQKRNSQDFRNIFTTEGKGYIDEDITQGEIYSYRVRALNHVIPSSWSNIVNVTIPVNMPPDPPHDPFPPDGAKDVETVVTLRWDAEDPNEDKLTFDVTIESTPEEYRKTVTTLAKEVSIDLKGHTTYIWKVVARDSEFCVEGPLWSFETRNHPPEMFIDDVEIFEGDTLILNLKDHAIDRDGDNLSFSLVKGPGVVENGRYLFTADFDDAGVQEVVFKINDGLDESTCSFHLIVKDKNRPPNVPQLLFPENGSTGVDVSKVTLSWKCSDPDGDELRYHVYFGENELFYIEETTYTSLTIENLKYGTTYIWKVIALDECGDITESNIFSFATKNWWTRVFDIEGEEKFNEIKKIGDKLYLLGSRTVDGENISSIAILDSEGNLLNIIDLGDFGPIYGLCEMDEGFVAITYGTFDTHILWLTGDFEISRDEVLKEITVGRTLLEWGNGYISVGSTINDKDGVVIFFDENGNVKVYEFNISKNVDEFSCAVMDGDELIVVGTIFSDDYDILLVKLNKDLEMVWSKKFEESFDVFGKYLIKGDNGYLISGKRFDTGRSSIYVLKVSEEGEKVWEETIEFDSSSFAESMVEDAVGAIIVGWKRNPHDGVIIKLTEDGKIAQKVEINGDDSDFLYDIVPIDEGFLILGGSDSWGKDKNIFLMKIDEYGNFSEEPEVITW